MSWFSLYCASIMSLSTVSEIPSKDITFVWQDLVSIRLCWLIFFICFVFNSLWDNFNSLYFYRLNGWTNRPTDWLPAAWIELTHIDCSSFSCCKSWIWAFSVESPIAAVVTSQTKPPLDGSSTSCRCRSLTRSCLGSAGCLGAGWMLRSLMGAWEPDGCLGAWWMLGSLRSLCFPEKKHWPRRKQFTGQPGSELLNKLLVLARNLPSIPDFTKNKHQQTSCLLSQHFCYSG